MVASEPQPDVATDALGSVGDEEENVSPNRNALKIGIIGISVLLILIIGGGLSFFWFRTQPRSADNVAVTEQQVAVSTAATTPAIGAPITTAPTAGLTNSESSLSSDSPNLSYTVLGRYSAFIADQDISLDFGGSTRQPLSAASGRATYANRVSDGTCTSRLIVDQVANEMSATYSQASILGQKPCEGSFPIRISINDAATDQSGAIQNLHVEWLNPANGRVVMAGDLTHSSGR